MRIQGSSRCDRRASPQRAAMLYLFGPGRFLWTSRDLARVRTWPSLLYQPVKFAFVRNKEIASILYEMGELQGCNRRLPNSALNLPDLAFSDSEISQKVLRAQGVYHIRWLQPSPACDRDPVAHEAELLRRMRVCVDRHFHPDLLRAPRPFIA